MYSMTGFGKGTFALDGRELTVELKSVNNRFLDISMRLPRILSPLEDTFRHALQDRLNRGHIDVYVNYRNQREDAKSVRVDTQLLEAYLTCARTAARELSITDDLTLSKALALPDVTEIVPAEEDQEALQQLGKTAVELAIDALLAMRHGEGSRLKKDLTARMDTMEGYAAAIAKPLGRKQEKGLPALQRIIVSDLLSVSMRCWVKRKWIVAAWLRKLLCLRIKLPLTKKLFV